MSAPNKSLAAKICPPDRLLGPENFYVSMIETESSSNTFPVNTYMENEQK